MCHKKLFAFILVTVTGIIFIFTDAKVLPKTLPYKQHTSLKWTPVPWLGVLTLGGQYKNESIGLIPVIMISDKKGIADARSMASLNKYNWENIRNNTYVMFLTKKSKAWYAKVEKIILHPEYNEDTLTTIAFLNLEYDLKKMEGSQIFEQILFRMDHIKLGECKAFYFVEDMGLSVWGPGCSLPARFVDFEPFVPWIMSNMETRRNYWQPESIGVRPEKFRDKWMLWRLTDTSLALRPLNLIGDQEKETVHGQCDDDNMRSDQLIYKEVTEFTTRRGLNRRAIKATAVYGLSLYDRNFNKTHYTCVQVVAKCSQKSDSKLEYSKGFEETDMFQPYVKILPVNPSSHQDVYPPYVHTIKDAWEKYEYEVIGTDITHLIFRFEFEVQGLIEVQFFGNRTDAYPPIETTTKLDYHKIYSCTRWRRPYKTRTLKPHRPYIYKDTWMWFVSYDLTTKSKTYKRPTSTTRRTKRRKAQNASTAYWWNKWWYFQTAGPPFLDKDWWKG
ncbi:unnamed protein product [Arctia plantaginis]|uniref:Uncharacterized protein n=1 Tax=Arctia plantaginis TaxID=874455 RepID=A0A8S0ZX04_ARCPL|nr:unnamed protein product [Arctia plantaginis]